jgi:hypothetical protein
MAILSVPNLPWRPAVLALCLICIYPNSVWAETVPVIYGIQTVSDSFIIKGIDLTDNGSFEKELVRIDRFPDEQIKDIVQLTTPDVALIKVSAQKQSVLATITNPAAVADVTRPVSKEIPVNGLSNGVALQHAVALNDTTLFGLTSDITDTPPFNIVSLNLESGRVTALKRYSLATDQRIGNFTRCPDNTIYATTLTRESSTRLLKIVPKNFKLYEVVRLRFLNEPLRNDVMSLACSPSGELYALADPTYEGTNSLFNLNQLDGQLTLLRQFDVEKITFNIPLPNQPLSEISGP